MGIMDDDVLHIVCYFFACRVVLLLYLLLYYVIIICCFVAGLQNVYNQPLRSPCRICIWQAFTASIIVCHFFRQTFGKETFLSSKEAVPIAISKTVW